MRCLLQCFRPLHQKIMEMFSRHSKQESLETVYLVHVSNGPAKVKLVSACFSLKSFNMDKVSKEVK